jgi:predicted MFS family arabinose efflux permease
MQAKAATYREVFAVREYRHLFGAYVLSLAGDQLAAVALAVLVYSASGSATLAAASFASTYLAWIVGAPLLSVFADRLPRRTVLIVCDVARAALFLALALTTMPALALVAIAFVGHLFHAPFLAARASLVPEILDDDRYTVANGLDNLFQSVAQIAGFALGGALLTVISAQDALLIDAATFALSAALIAVGVRRRSAAAAPEDRTGLADAVAGVRIIATDRTLRAYVLLLWVGCAFVFAPEGLMVTLSAQYGGGAALSGILLAAAPLGGALGAVVLTRLCGPIRRQQLILPLAALSCAALVPIVLMPPLWVVLTLLAVAGFANAYCVPLNPLFGRAVPNEYRARAFGVAIGGLCAAQGLGMLGAGMLAEILAPTTVIAVCGAAGTLAVAAVALTWPRTAARPALVLAA